MLESGAMNNEALALGGFVVLMATIQFAWYVAVIVFLYKIWSKVRHLPG
jgi:hypothetical protein